MRVDLSQEKVRELEAKAEKEKEALKLKAKQDIDTLLKQQVILKRRWLRVCQLPQRQIWTSDFCGIGVGPHHPLSSLRC